MIMENIYLAIVLSPLIGSIIVGFFGYYLGKTLSHWIAILGVLVSTILSWFVFEHHILNQAEVFNQNLYTWLSIGKLNISIGFMIDNLTAMMMMVVNFISLMVHIYTIGYMKEDKGYTRFFSYISLFTFSMLMLIMSNNFMQLFFGWEAVGLVSYLLIGFWFTKESAIFANMKAFLVNRVGDFGFLLGIALIFIYTGSMDYKEIFAQSSSLSQLTIFGDTSLITVICLLLFVGAMGKSAQVPLHVWLPDSMEGPTPISALIHAATMVTAGIFMVSRMSPLFELSEVALITIMIIGATTAILMGFLGCIQTDIKKVVAYSTLSQLGYMTVALGVSAYSVAIFHLVTHAFFKALLFLAAGSIIVALHHQQDMRKMGGLWKKMPITYITMFIGTLALIGMPGFAGFYSKDMIIEAAHFSTLPYANIIYYVLVLGVGLTAFYSFRLFFMVFHGKDNTDKHHKIKESEYSITIPLMLLAIPSVMIGFVLIEPILFGDFFSKGIFAKSIFIADGHTTMVLLKNFFHSAYEMILHSFQTLTFWTMILGIFLAWLLVLKQPNIAYFLNKRFFILRSILEKGYGFDKLNEVFFAKGSRGIGRFFSNVFDIKLIDTFIINGVAVIIVGFANISRKIQTGYLYHYAFWMIIGLLLMLSYLLF
ncbi:NADH-ubiquinone oxidoreductase chain L [hydrothermal vent metagenome]|uniref:NADH-ubiquinone oxidoreductase chain 5 n=1 Tax=hydrothermal vent metagenome TaxID=652676 RepID=A0A1W1CBR5_9ZZZZ